MPGSSRKSGTRLDIASLAGIVLAIGGILGGLILEGGKVTDVSQVTAAIIVLGGTVGAVMLTSPMAVFLRAGKRLKDIFFDQSHGPEAIIEEIIALATKARKQGMVSLEGDVEKIEDPFLKKALSLAVDGADLNELRRMMELEILLEEQDGEAEAKVFELAGGYAPTIGIIGAVLGLIQVMKHLENIEEVGKGIAVAFVATVYGVGAANLFFLPAAGKLKSRTHHAVQTRELMLEGVSSIVEGMNPKLIRTKLDAYVRNKDPKKAKAVKAGSPAVSEPASA
jgi:chemotaxis protein MotA